MANEQGKRDTGGGDNPIAGIAFRERAGARGGTGLGPGAEFDLIRGFLGKVPDRHELVELGPGDDAAVVRGERIVLSSDLSIEGTHFRRDWLTPYQIGYRAATAALSDLAAMAARPIGVLASLGVPPADAGTYATELMGGVRAAVGATGGIILGGDLTSSVGPIILDIVAVGTAATPILRSGAQPGDEVWVTGRLGGAALAVDALLRGELPAEGAMEAFVEPVARVKEAIWLAGKGIPRAMLDLSDGLGGDASHLAAASGVAVVVDAELVPIHPALERAVAPALALKLAISGGEDYEICFTCGSGTVDSHRDEFERRHGCSLTRVGHVEPGEGVYISEGGVRRSLTRGGFQHFEGGR